MHSPPLPMDIDPSPSRRRKRAASDASPSVTAPTANDNTPQIVTRRRHRRRNVAATVWGNDLPLTPSTAFTVAYPNTTTTAAHPTPAPFNIYKSLLRHPNLFFQFAIRLPLPSMLDLYAIDKEFHYRLNKFSVSLMHDYARYHAPLASYIFSWVLYPELCISDPMLRPMDGRSWLARDVPGFRWVGMVLWRQGVVRGILTELAVAGHRVPAGMEGAVCKFWVVMEVNSTRMREAFLRDTEVWSDQDLLLVQMLLVKLDMRFSDPTVGNGACALSHMLLTQKSLSALWYVLTGKVRLTYDTTTDLVVRTYLTGELDLDALPWLDDEVENGVPEEWWGIQTREGWHSDGGKMESAVDMVIAEGIRRGLHVQQNLLDFVLYGYLEENGKNAKVARRWRADRKVVEKDGWPGKEERDTVIKRLNEQFGIATGGGHDAMDMSA
ncbi:hypothetical protein EK21DRAFT_82537 [Setomelanomma holmii]|uniref:Uncharacterized protein n=1 Tax=Setomelanomma holmii TaxID=210430 RepID=A0A9P4GVH3_9PLEO|nr:hypothetical protein EK21DRAFT_82537 [Setomelanomma holmii]